MAAPPPDKFVGRQLGKFKIEKRLGAGGMGAVYKATDNLGRTVALKLLQAGFSSEPEWIERFRREAEKAAQLTHPHIVQVYEFGEAEGLYYLSMQFMVGGSLDGVLAKRGPLPPAEAARMVRDACRGLARAHKAGLIHRDIKPANILIGEEGEVRLGDFGLVKSTKGDDQPLTQTGMVLGTPHYMAPEQCEGLPDVDGRVDVFAMGIVLYQCLSNVLPVKGSTPLQILRHRIEQDVPPLRSVAPNAPQALADLVAACTVRDPARRLASADELVRRLDAYLAGAPAGAGAAPAAGAALDSAATTPLTPPPGPGAAKVPTGRLVGVMSSKPGVLPELPAEPARKPSSWEARAQAAPVAAAAAPPAKPAGRTSGCWLVGCGLLAFVLACLAGAVISGMNQGQDVELPHAGF